MGEPITETTTDATSCSKEQQKSKNIKPYFLSLITFI